MSVPNMWRTKKQRYSLRGNVCPECSNVIFPPRGVCPYCSGNHAADAKDGALLARRNGARPHSVTFAMPVAVEPVAVAAGDD